MKQHFVWSYSITTYYHVALTHQRCELMHHCYKSRHRFLGHKGPYNMMSTTQPWPAQWHDPNGQPSSHDRPMLQNAQLFHKTTTGDRKTALEVEEK